MKFNPILMQKITEEKDWENKQEKLKEETGINDQNVVLKSSSMKDYIVTFLRCILYITFIVLIFIGLITALNPASRLVITELFSVLFQSTASISARSGAITASASNPRPGGPIVWMARL